MTLKTRNDMSYIPFIFKNIEFKMRVKLLVSPMEFVANKEVLSLVPEEHFETYIKCLAHGANMLNAYNSLDLISQITRATRLADEDVLRIMPEFKNLQEKLFPEK